MVGLGSAPGQARRRDGRYPCIRVEIRVVLNGRVFVFSGSKPEAERLCFLPGALARTNPPLRLGGARRRDGRNSCIRVEIRVVLNGRVFAISGSEAEAERMCFLPSALARTNPPLRLGEVRRRDGRNPCIRVEIRVVRNGDTGDPSAQTVAAMAIHASPARVPVKVRWVAPTGTQSMSC